MHGAGGLIATALIRLLEVLFVVGVVGSALVIILSSIEDARTLRNRETHDTAGENSVAPRPASPAPQE